MQALLQKHTDNQWSAVIEPPGGWVQEFRDFLWSLPWVTSTERGWFTKTFAIKCPAGRVEEFQHAYSEWLIHMQEEFAW